MVVRNQGFFQNSDGVVKYKKKNTYKLLGNNGFLCWKWHKKKKLLDFTLFYSEESAKHGANQMANDLGNDIFDKDDYCGHRVLLSGMVGFLMYDYFNIMSWKVGFEEVELPGIEENEWLNDTEHRRYGTWKLSDYTPEVGLWVFDLETDLLYVKIFDIIDKDYSDCEFTEADWTLLPMDIFGRDKEVILFGLNTYISKHVILTGCPQMPSVPRVPLISRKTAEFGIELRDGTYIVGIYDTEHKEMRWDMYTSEENAYDDTQVIDQGREFYPNKEIREYFEDRLGYTKYKVFAELRGEDPADHEPAIVRFEFFGLIDEEDFIDDEWDYDISLGGEAPFVREPCNLGDEALMREREIEDREWVFAPQRKTRPEDTTPIKREDADGVMWFGMENELDSINHVIVVWRWSMLNNNLNFDVYRGFGINDLEDLFRIGQREEYQRDLNCCNTVYEKALGIEGFIEHYIKERYNDDLLKKDRFIDNTGKGDRDEDEQF